MEKEVNSSNSIVNEEYDIAKNYRTCEFNINKDYQYVSKNPIFNLISGLLYYCIAIPVLWIVIKVIYGLKIEGRENIKKVKKGAISVSNHVLVLDCAIVGLGFGFRKKIFYTTQEESFQIPLVRKIIKLLRAIPIPKKMENKKVFIKEMGSLLEKGNVIHFYPEAVLKPYAKNIRSFKSGAFILAVKNNVPVLPIVLCFRTPSKFRKIFKKKKDVTLKFLEPVEIGNKTEKELKECVQKYMESEINKK